VQSTFKVLVPLLLTGFGCASGPQKLSSHDAVAMSQARPSARQAVVSVVIDGQDPDQGSPWAKGRPWRRRINGLVVTGRRILVHGRRLAHHTLIMVEKMGASKRYEAELIEVDYELPLALLTVKDPAFWEDLEPLEISDDVPSEGDVKICRWLDSGQFEEARAVVKQLRVADHFPGDVQLLTLEVSSPITAAGWGEIVLSGGEVVGITTSSSDDQLPVLAAPVLRQFLDHVESGTYKGFARHGFAWQRLSNPALRAQLGLQESEGGIRVRNVQSTGSAAGALKPGDVLLELGGYAIDERGKFEHTEYGKLYFGVLFTDGVAPGDTLEAKVLRGGERINVQLKLRAMPVHKDVVPRYVFDRAPEYLQVGGLVFQPLTADYMRMWRRWWENGPLRLLVEMHAKDSGPHQEGEQLLILSRVLPDPVNLGYHDLRALLVTRVNGKAVRSMADLAVALASPQAGFHIVDFAPGQSASRIVINATEAAQAGPRIQQRYGLAAPSAN